MIVPWEKAIQFDASANNVGISPSMLDIVFGGTTVQWITGSNVTVEKSMSWNLEDSALNTERKKSKLKSEMKIIKHLRTTFYLFTKYYSTSQKKTSCLTNSTSSSTKPWKAWLGRVPSIADLSLSCSTKRLLTRGATCFARDVDVNAGVQ